MSTESLTSKVHEARVDLGITQQQLADATGISVRTIISIEKGRQFPTLLSAMRIAHYFSLSVDQLLEYKCDDKSEKEKTNDLSLAKYPAYMTEAASFYAPSQRL